MTTDWTLKVFAFLHDPPHKPLALGTGHERKGQELARIWTGADIPAQDFDRWVKPADQVASGADRESLLREFEVDPRRELTLVHPFDGTDLAVRRPEDDVALARQRGEIIFEPNDVDEADALVRAVFEEIGPWTRTLDSRERFYLLWRFLPDLLRQAEKKGAGRARLGAIWEFFPADTRMPNHPVLVHCSLTSALAEIHRRDDKAALLSLAIGPVQSLIGAARRTSDLWGGSALLSKTLFEAVRAIAENLGPDHVIFPALRGQPLFDEWLLGLSWGDSRPRLVQELFRQASASLKRGLRTPSLPNRFVAVVPQAQVRELGEAAAQEARKFWKERAKEGARALGGPDGWGLEDQEIAFFRERAQQQAERVLEVTWAAVPWPATAGALNAALETVPRLLASGEPLAKGAFRVAEALPGFRPNGGLLYGDVYAEGQRLLDAVKRARLAPAHREEHGLKCSICGEREVLGREGASFADERRGWRELEPRKTSWVAEGEALCGPCWMKRWVGLESLPSFRHPSTGEIAASHFKLEVILACQRDTAAALCEAVSNFVRAAEQAGDPADLNVWCSQAVLDAVRGDNLLEKFAHIDGQYLLPWPRERGAERQEPVWRDLLRAGARVRREAKQLGLSAPRPYLAAVHFDGDEIGRWLSGDHPRTPETFEMLHHKIRERLREESPPNALELLKEPRRVTPAIHAALSEACAAFSQIGAPLTVESEGLPAHLVYAGGDDALVLAPVENVLELVRRLRLRFSGYPWKFDLQGDYEVSEGSDVHDHDDLHARARAQPFRNLRGYVVCRRAESGMPRPGDDEVRLAFGGRVTASAGICVFHYTWPLGDALERMREAEKLAKDELGRNAVGIEVVRRSGSVTRTGLKFVPDDDHGADSVRTLQRLVTAFRTALSPRLYTNLAADLAPLRLGDSARSGTGATVEQRARDVELWEIAIALGRRASKRRGDGDRAPADLPRWLESLASACGRPNSGARGVLRWLDLIGTAAFLGRPGEVGS